MGVSRKNATLKSSILIDVIGFSIINHPFWGCKHPYFWKHPCIIYGLFTQIMHIGSIQKMQRYSTVNRRFFKIVVDFELIAMYRSRWWFQQFDEHIFSDGLKPPPRDVSRFLSLANCKVSDPNCELTVILPPDETCHEFEGLEAL